MRVAETDGRRGLRTCGEAATAAQQNLHGRYRVDVVIVDADSLEGKIDVVEFGRGVVNEARAARVRRSGRVRN